MQSLIERVSLNNPECTKIVSREFSHHATDDELILLVEALKRNSFVGSIDFLHTRRTTELCRELAALFRTNATIQYVRLPSRTNNEELLLISESLCDNKTLTTLDLTNCDIRGSQGGGTIRTLLWINGTIIEIRLCGNLGLGAEGVACVAQALRDERCVLKKLDLGLCGIGNDGARDLSTALGNNTVLEELYIRHNQITFVGFRHIVEVLETKSFLQVLDLTGNNLDQDSSGHGTASDLLSRVFECDGSLRDFNFDWYEGISAMELVRLVEGLRCNKTLVSIHTRREGRLQGDGTKALWRTRSQFVTGRNKMRPLLEGSGEEEASSEPVLQSLWPHLLKWCCNRSRYGNESMEAQASLIHHVLCARSNHICEWVTTTTTTKRPAPEG